MSKKDKIAARRRTANPYPDLDALVNRRQLDRHLAAGIVSAATHERLPLYVYNYTGRCEKRRCWDQVTVTCRGLVRDNKRRVVSRPFQKFFGYGQKTTSAVRAVRWTDDWYAVEKLDGTMVTAGNMDGDLVLATRGSFDAWQLDRARQLWPDGLVPDPGTTWVLEYVGPDNQIVVGYERDELALLGVIDNWDGSDVFGRYDELAALDAFRIPERFDAATVEALHRAAPDDGTFEGFVVVWPRRGQPSGRLKVKQQGWLDRHAERFARPGDDLADGGGDAGPGADADVAGAAAAG